MVRGGYSKITSSAGIIGFGMLFSKAGSLFAEVIIARELSTGVFGSAIFAYTALLTLSSFILFGLPDGITYFLSIYDERNDNTGAFVTVLFALFVAIILSSIVFIILNGRAFQNSVVNVISAEEYRWLRLLSPLVVAYPLSRISIGVIRAYGSSLPKVFSDDIANKIVSISILYGLIRQGNKAFLFQSFYLLQYIFSAIFSFVFALRALIDNVQTQFQRKKLNLYVRNFVDYTIPLGAKKVVRQIIGNSDILLVGILLPSTAVGIYRVSYVISQLGMVPLMAVLYSYVPELSRYFEADDTAKMQKLYKRTTNFAIILGLPLSLTMIFFPSVIIKYLFGNGFEGAGIVLSILAIDVSLRVGLGVGGSSLLAIGRTTEDFFITLLALVVNIPLSYFMIQEFQIMGAAISSLLTILLINGSQIYLVKRYISIHPFTLSLVKLATLTSLASPLVYIVIEVLISGYRLPVANLPLAPMLFCAILLTIEVLIALHVDIEGVDEIIDLFPRGEHTD